MTNLAITDVQQITKVTPTSLVLGETCAAFDIVQQIGSKYERSIATDAAKGKPSHILMQGGDDTDLVVALPLANGLQYTLTGPTLVVAAQYVVSATAGKIAERADLTVGQFLTDVLKGSTAAIADIQIEETEIAEPA